MEPQKDKLDQSANVPGSVTNSAQSGQGEPAENPAPALQPSVTPEPTVQPAVPGAGQAPAPADGAVEPLPTPEAYGSLSPVASPAAAVSKPGKSGPGRKKLLIAAGVGLATLLAVGGVVFGLYLPNTQGNVWNTGINRSGKAVDALVQSATTADKLKTYATSDIRGSFDATASGVKYSGTLTTTFDKSNLNAALDVSVGGGGQTEAMSAKFISKLAAGSVYPDLYVQLTGLKALGLDFFVPGISDYDGKWIKIDSAYLKSLGDSYVPVGDNTKTQITAQNIAEVARAASSVTKDYVFSTAKDKAVFEKQSFVGKEQTDGVTAYHYKVNINKQHFEAYCEAVSNAVLATDGYKKLTGATSAEISDQKKAVPKDCKSEADDTLKDAGAFDMWIDVHYKLIYKIRAYDKGNSSAYTDIGQLYKGGNKLSLFMVFHDGTAKSDGKLTVDTDLQTSTTKATLTMKSTGDSPYDLTATLQATMNNKPVQVTVPSNTIPVQDVLKKYGLDGALAGGGALSGASQKAEDSERQTDINAIMSHLEAYYAEKGYYPTLAQLNDGNWRNANMHGLDSEALKAPNGTSAQLASAASTTQYGYAPGSCNARGCQSYTLRALLSDGTAYEKTSFMNT